MARPASLARRRPAGAVLFAGVGGVTAAAGRAALGYDLSADVGGFGGAFATGLRVSAGPEVRF